MRPALLDRLRRVSLVLLLVAALAGCRAERRFEVKGRVAGFGQDGTTLIVDHEAIPGFMDAMTMPIKTAPGTTVPDSIEIGDAVGFTLVVGREASYLTGLVRLADDAVARAPAGDLAHPAAADPARNVIAVGDTIRSQALTDHTGRRFDVVDERGRALVVDFIYTRCPLPDFCPRLSAMMQRLDAPLRERYGDRVGLLTLSFDPAHDTPEVLADYRRRYTTAPDAAWRFAVPDSTDLTGFSRRFGLNLSPGPRGTVEHALVTLLVGPDGVVRRVWREADATPEAVTRELDLLLR